MIEGIILKGIGGFYYVDTAEGLIECKARGRFRKTVGKPIIGDRVMLEIQPEDGTGYLTDIHPRKNSLVRPAVANLDLLAVVLEVPLFPAPRVMLVLRVLPDQRVIMARPVLPGPLDLRVLPDQLAPQANVVLPDRTQSLLNSVSTSPRLRQLRLMARRLMSKMHSDRRTPSRTALGTTPL